MKNFAFFAVAALCVLAQTDLSAQTVSSAQMPSIELVGTNTVALGPISCYEFKLVKFVFRNPGDLPVEITKIIPTCPCVRGYPETALLPPKGEATVTLEFNPTIVHGAFKRLAWVQTTDPLQKRIGLSLTGEILPLFTGLPEMPFLFRRAGIGEAWTNRVTLTATETNLFLGAPVIAKSETFTVTATVTSNLSEKVSYDVTLVVTPLTEGRTATSMDIPVLGRPGLPPLRLTFQGRIGTELGIAPRQILLTPSTNTLSRRLLIQTSDTNMSPENLTWTPRREGVTVEVKASGASTSRRKSSNLSVTVHITPEAAAALLKEKDAKMTFSYANYKSVDIVFSPSDPAASVKP